MDDASHKRQHHREITWKIVSSSPFMINLSNKIERGDISKRNYRLIVITLHLLNVIPLGTPEQMPPKQTVTREQRTLICRRANSALNKESHFLLSLSNELSGGCFDENNQLPGMKRPAPYGARSFPSGRMIHVLLTLSLSWLWFGLPGVQFGNLWKPFSKSHELWSSCDEKSSSCPVIYRLLFIKTRFLFPVGAFPFIPFRCP